MRIEGVAIGPFPEDLRIFNVALLLLANKVFDECENVDSSETQSHIMRILANYCITFLEHDQTIHGNTTR